MSKAVQFINKFQSGALGIVRIITGLCMAYHGMELFDDEKMKAYLQWDQFKTSSSAWLVYAGKTGELVAGFFLSIGLFTRIAALVIAAVMLSISLFIGNGRIWYEDQHPFLFVLLALIFFFTGAGKSSFDHLLFNKNKELTTRQDV